MGRVDVSMLAPGSGALFARLFHDFEMMAPQCGHMISNWRFDETGWCIRGLLYRTLNLPLEEGLQVRGLQVWDLWCTYTSFVSHWLTIVNTFLI